MNYIDGRVYLGRVSAQKHSFFRTTGGTPSGPYAFLESSPERAVKTSLEEILISGRSKFEGGGDGGTTPESSKLEFEEKVCTSSWVLSLENIATEPSG